MSQLMHVRPSVLMGLTDSWAAWCVDEAIAVLTIELQDGKTLRHPKTKDNHDLLKKAGVK